MVRRAKQQQNLGGPEEPEDLPMEQSPPAQLPIRARGRTEAKIVAMTERAAKGQNLFHPDDGEPVDLR